AQEFLDRTMYRQELEAAYVNMRKLVRAGVRVLPGGDYGFAWCPHGEYARDLQTFVEHIGLTPMQTLVAATRWGSELMRMEDRIGTLERGKLADLLLVDGNPLDDIRILQDKTRLALGVEGGQAKAVALGLDYRMGPGWDCDPGPGSLENDRRDAARFERSTPGTATAGRFTARERIMIANVNGIALNCEQEGTGPDLVL